MRGVALQVCNLAPGNALPYWNDYVPDADCPDEENSEVADYVVKTGLELKAYGFDK